MANSPYDTIKSAILGLPLDPLRKPSREGVVKAFAEMQIQLEGAQAGALIFATVADMNDSAFKPTSSMAWVTNDSVWTNNGIYRQAALSGSNNWQRVTSIPQFFIMGINTDAGGPNAILANTDLPLPTVNGRALIAVNVTQTNTENNVTVKFNNGSILNLINNTGAAIKAGALIVGQILVGFINDGDFRLITDQLSAHELASTIEEAVTLKNQAAASALAAAASALAAQNSANIAVGAASDAVAQSNVPVYGTINGLAAITIPIGLTGIRVNGKAAVGDGGGGDFIRVVSEPSVPAKDKFQTAGGVWWKRYNDTGQRPILIMGDGQSNIMLTPSYSWTPPPNVFHWNWDGFAQSDTDVGTAFSPMSGTRIGAAMSFAAEVAKDNPDRKVYLVNIGKGDQAISHWLPGTTSPDMFLALDNNMTAAAAAIGEPYDLIHFRWQGETDAYANNTNYVTNFATYRNRLLAEPWYPIDTPVVNMGMSEYVTVGPNTLKDYNRYLAWVSSIYADYMTYVHTSIIGTSYWEPSDGGNKIHMTADGYRRAGILAYSRWSKGVGRALNPNSFADPGTGYLLTQKPAFAARRQLAVTGDNLVTNYSTVDFNLGSYFNGTTGLFTAPLPGLYLFSYKAGVQSGGGSIIINLRVAGANYPGSQVIATGAFNTAQHTMLVYLTAGITVGLQVTSGTTVADANGTMLSGHLIG